MQDMQEYQEEHHLKEECNNGFQASTAESDNQFGIYG